MPRWIRLLEQNEKFGNRFGRYAAAVLDKVNRIAHDIPKDRCNLTAYCAGEIEALS